ncbi:hypothetical protein APF70_10740 [Vibrio parahaemolyticus]|nr:hypothetical protein APF56_05980 [Vibrio parahaemolyticus]KZW20117.1 hypothetical protein APF60_12335 [Vibrio parahaemolyticus]KZW22391.1 hypothetical protein APF61_10230 [Vibrio parahaemolyticus]KZW37274.1 hypothetical protein APF64_07130 [Vibrio parahaemolyticus]KZW44058.1 hypothetical protein APF65_10725 [Vibrio parahaemolyticus]
MPTILDQKANVKPLNKVDMLLLRLSGSKSYRPRAIPKNVKKTPPDVSNPGTVTTKFEGFLLLTKKTPHINPINRTASETHSIT